MEKTHPRGAATGRMLEMIGAIEACLAERCSVLDQLARLPKGPQSSFTVMEQTALQDHLEDLTRQQQALLEELEILLSPDGSPLA